MDTPNLITRLCEKVMCLRTYVGEHWIFGMGRLGPFSGSTRPPARVRRIIVDFSRYMWEGVQEVVDRRVEFADAIKTGMSCDHVAGERHRLAMFDLFKMVHELQMEVPTGSGPVPLGGVRVGTFGIVLMGFAATDIWAILRNVLLEDEHCAMCCGKLLRTVEGLNHQVLLRCGPTIGAREMSADDARRITDEYWTD